MGRRNKNFRFFEEKCKNVLQGWSFCIEKKKNSDEGSVFPWDFCKGGWGGLNTKNSAYLPDN